MIEIRRKERAEPGSTGMDYTLLNFVMPTYDPV
jgi:hypothetical protein